MKRGIFLILILLRFPRLFGSASALFDFAVLRNCRPGRILVTVVQSIILLSMDQSPSSFGSALVWILVWMLDVAGLTQIDDRRSIPRSPCCVSLGYYFVFDFVFDFGSMEIAIKEPLTEVTKDVVVIYEE